MFRLACAALVVLTACSPTPPSGTGGGNGGGNLFGGGSGGSSGSGGGGGGGTGGGGSGGGSGGGAGGGGGASALTEAQRVAIFCEKTRTPNCSQWFTSQQQCVDLLSRTQHALCQAKWEAETDCLDTTQPSDWVCTPFGEPAIASTRCRDQYGFGSYCRIAIANTECFLGACQYNSDCPSGYSCNDKTERCFNTSASCGGLPCTYNADCPTGFTCNNSLEQCVRQ